MHELSVIEPKDVNKGQLSSRIVASRFVFETILLRMVFKESNRQGIKKEGKKNQVRIDVED